MSNASGRSDSSDGVGDGLDEDYDEDDDFVDAEDDVQSDYDDRDESYVYNDDEESEYEESPQLRSRKRTSNESSNDDNSSTNSRKKSRGSSDRESIESKASLIFFPLENYKVPELKKFLADRSLPVGGEYEINVYVISHMCTYWCRYRTQRRAN